jgi:hypothetical protein
MRVSTVTVDNIDTLVHYVELKSIPENSSSAWKAIQFPETHLISWKLI